MTYHHLGAEHETRTNTVERWKLSVIKDVLSNNSLDLYDRTQIAIDLCENEDVDNCLSYWELGYIDGKLMDLSDEQ